MKSDSEAQREDVAKIRRMLRLAVGTALVLGVVAPAVRSAQKLAGDEPTETEARAALNGYIGYFGALTVYPGQVFHHPLASK